MPPDPMQLLTPFRPILRDRALALSATLITLFGIYGASLMPYVSALGVHLFGLSDSVFAIVLVATSLVSVASSVGFGIYADQKANRRGVALLALAFPVIGTGGMLVAPSAPMFVVVHALILPLAAVLFGHLFALARLAASDMEETERLAVLTALRALFALPWVVVLPIWALAIGRGVTLGAIYPVCFAVSVLMFGLAFAFWPKDGKTRWVDTPSGLGLRAALAEIGDRAVLIRVAALGGINAAPTLYLVLLGLVFAAIAGRGDGATALYAGIVAGLEVPFMMALALIVGRVGQARLILIGTVLYCIHLVALPFLAPSALVWGLTVFGAAGGAIILTQPMAYMQDLLGDRPGAGASLFALQRLVGDATAAAIFAIGTAIGGYGFAAVLGTALALGAGWLLVSLDRRRMR